ncbi:MAG: hypothetical protein Pars2KO_05050 [Parasphingorhabdus sp.]
MRTPAKTYFLATAAIGLVIASPNVAMAQENEGASEGGVIVVTARKTEESLLEAPLSITAFGEEQIENLGLQSIEDVQLFTPGFVFEAFATVPGRFDQSPRFRGIDIDTGDPFRQTASVFIDGVYVINGASGVSLNDIARVEVIKGPQSAVYGRNTFGGAINYITKTPGDELAVDFSASVSTRDDYEFSVGVEGPIVPGILSGRVSGSFRDKAGHFANTFDENNIVFVNPFSFASASGVNNNTFISAGTGTTGAKLGDQQTWNISASLFFTPSDRFSAKLRAAYFENDDGPPAVGEIRFSQANCGPFGGSQTRRFFCGELNTDNLLPIGSEIGLIPGLADTLDNLNVLNGRRNTFGFDRQNLTLSGQFDFDITDNITLSGLFGYSAEDTTLLSDGDAVPVRTRFFASANDRQFRMNSQELRLSGSAFNDFIDWSIGASRFWQESRNAGGFLQFNNGALTPITMRDTIARERVETLGVFGSLAFNLSDDITATFEGRYQQDDIFDNPNEAMPTNNQAKFKNFLPRVILDFQATPDTLIYASYAKGNNPGGFNPDVIELSATDLAFLLTLDPLAQTTFDEEELDSYEIGVKHGFANGRGSVALTAFLMERAGQQFRTSVTDPQFGGTVTYFLNRGETEIRGFEFEGTVKPADFLTFTASIGYVDAEFQVVADTVFENYFGTQDASGQKAARYPKWSGSFSVAYEDELPSGLGIFARADTSYVGKRFSDISNLSFSNDGFITNLRAGVEPGNFRIEAFVKNLTNANVPTGVGRTSDFASLFFGQYSYRLGLRDRRQFGLRFSGEF